MPSIQVVRKGLIVESSGGRLVFRQLLENHLCGGGVDVFFLEVLSQFVEGNIFLVVRDIPESLDQLSFLGFAVLLLDDKAVDEVLFGEFGLGTGWVDAFFDHAYLVIADGYGDEFEEHPDVLPHGLVGLAGDAHPVVEEGQLLAVLAVVDHRI